MTRRLTRPRRRRSRLPSWVTLDRLTEPQLAAVLLAAVLVQLVIVLVAAVTLGGAL